MSTFPLESIGICVRRERDDATRDLVRGEPVPQRGLSPALVERSVGLRHDRGRHHLAPVRVVDPEDEDDRTRR